MSGKLTFDMTLPSGTETTPDCDRWTFHHVLPRRYYFSCAYTLVMATRHQCTDQNQLNGLTRHAAYAAIKRVCDEDARNPAYGSGSSTFGRLSLTAGQLIKLIKKMANNDFDGTLLNHGLDAEKLALTCRAPKFGGFAGMDGAQRAKDPDERPEPIRPHSASKDWWGALSILRKHLDSCCQALADATGGKTVSVAAEKSDVEGIITQLNLLTGNHDRVHPFFPKDWDYKPQGSKKLWKLDESAETGGQVSAYFELNSDGQGVNGKAALTFTRPSSGRGNLLFHAK